MIALAERFPTVSRHLAVLRAAWRQQNAADKARKPRLDHEFLPAALEIIETPPSPGLRLLLLVLCSLFAIAFAWSIFARVDVVAVATGKTLPGTSVKLIQPSELGAVRAIHVRNGQHVRKGELLIELDPTVAGAEEAQASRGLLAAQVAEARNRALLDYLRGRPARFQVPANTPPMVVDTQRRLIASAVAEYEAQRASLLQARAEHGAELAASQAEVAKLNETLPLIDEQLSARRQLTARGHFPKLKLLEYEQARVEHVHDIDVQGSNSAKAAAAIANIDAQLRQAREEFGRKAGTDLATAEDDATVRGEDVRKSERRTQLQRITSPVDGTVQQLAVHTIGGIVQPAQALMLIVPDGSDVEVEAQILNKDIGFVREGQRVRVKVEAYPFTEFGLIDGVVDTISRDAVQQDNGGGPGEGKKEPAAALVYNARIRLSRNWLTVGGARQALGPGMAVQAEIRTGRRRVIQYLLSPIARGLDEAGRER